MATPIKRGRSYCYGVVQKDADVHNPKFRFKENAIPGDFLLDSGVETWEEFFLLNPRNEKRSMTHTVYEIELKDGKRTLRYVTEGMFAPPGTFRRHTPETLGDGEAADATILRETQPTPLAAYAQNPISLPEINEIVQSTVAAQAEFASEQMNLLRSILEEKDKFIYSLQQSEQQKIDAATAMYTQRITALEKQLQELTTENSRLGALNAVLQSQVEKLEWQAKEAKKIEERMQKDFEEATKVVQNQNLSDGGGLGFLDKLLDRPLDEVVRGIAALKEMFSGTSSDGASPSAIPYSQEQLQQLYEQARRYGIIPGGMPGMPGPGGAGAGMPGAGMPNVGMPTGTPPSPRPPAGQAGNPAMGSPTMGSPAAAPGTGLPLTPGAAIAGTPTTPPATTQAPPYAHVQTV